VAIEDSAEGPAGEGAVVIAGETSFLVTGPTTEGPA
jgi:hypothetical protein